MGKPTGFLDYTRVNCPSRDAAARTGDYAPVELPLSERNRRRQSGRCMDCGVPFCQAGASFEGVLLGCPLHNLIPEWNDLLWNGNYEGALQRLLAGSVRRCVKEPASAARCPSRSRSGKTSFPSSSMALKMT